eukprot:scaffold193172_cov31-Tisochrysis_lutea.AAC.4
MPAGAPPWTPANSIAAAAAAVASVLNSSPCEVVWYDKLQAGGEFGSACAEAVSALRRDGCVVGPTAGTAIAPV